jgi:hypothetical protein
MRRVFLVMVVAGLVTGVMAGPALASSQVHHRFRSAAVVAVWRLKVRESSTRFTLTTWFVGVFPSARDTASQVVREVDQCQEVSGRQRCQVVSFAAGFRKSLPAAQFTFDAKHLQTARLHATFQLHTFKPKPGRTFAVTIAAAWTGTGKISHSGGVSSFHSGCLHFHDTFQGRQRPAIATGSANGKSLGSTHNAFLATSTDVVVEHQC